MINDLKKDKVQSTCSVSCKGLDLILDKDITPRECLQAVEHLLEGRPKVPAQNAGLPEAVIYRTDVDNTLDKYLLEVSLKMSDRVE